MQAAESCTGTCDEASGTSQFPRSGYTSIEDCLVSAAEKQNRYPCDQVVPIEQEPRHHLVIENEFVRAFAVEIAPRDRTLCHHHPHDYLMYVVGDAEIISAAREQEPKRLSYRDGECELLAAGLTHIVENRVDTRFRNIVVELLPRTHTMRRVAAPTWIGGEANVSQILDDERAAIFSIELGPGAQVEIAGPAVVATPYDNDLNPALVGEVDVKPNDTCDLAWIQPGCRAVLWGCWKDAETAIVFQLGRTEDQGLAVPVAREPLKKLHARAEEPD